MAKNTQNKMPTKYKKPAKELPTNHFLMEFIHLANYARTCIPPTTDRRSAFFTALCSEYYAQFTEEQRSDMFNAIVTDHRFSLGNPDCRHFYDRYFQGNQYIVHVMDSKGNLQTFETYLHNGKHHLTHFSSLPDKSIVKKAYKYQLKDVI